MPYVSKGAMRIQSSHLFLLINALVVRCFCVKCANTVPFGYNFDPRMALENVYTLPRIACEGLPRRED